jgi:hypothetical protein
LPPLPSSPPLLTSSLWNPPSPTLLTRHSDEDDDEDREDDPDCDGRAIDAEDQRWDWLGDGICDKTNLDFNCAKFNYDCCDCRSSKCGENDENGYCDSRRRTRRKRKLAASPPSRELTAVKKTTACHKCSSGFYCPEDTVQADVVKCPTGFYCSTPASKEECPINHYCSKTRATQCLLGMYCPPGATSATYCPPKSFCSEPQ